MGLGGNLTYTPFARCVFNATGKKVTFTKKGGVELSKVWKNNPYINNSKNGVDKTIKITVKDSINYCKKSNKDRAWHDSSMHIIERFFNVYKDYQLDELRCDVFLDKEQRVKVQTLMKSCREMDRGFITIEPNHKQDYTKNNQWFYDRWQKVVDKLKDKYTFVQVGLGDKLNGVVDMRKKGFMESVGLIKHSKLFLSQVCGLMHGSNAVKTKSIIVCSGYEHPNLACYPDDIVFWTGYKCAPCGLKKACKEKYACMREITSEMVAKKVKEVMSGSELSDNKFLWRR